MIAPNPENTGRATRVPNVPQGSSGYVAPGGQVLYPGDAGGGTVPWSGASGLTGLLQTIAGSGLGSLFGVNGPGGPGDTGSLGPGSPVSGSQLVDFMSTLFQMPIMNQYSGNFGSRNDDAGAAIANFAATLHRMGDPTGGRVPGTSKNDPNIPGPADFAAHARAVGAQIMKQWTDYELHGHDPNRGSPIRGSVHPEWWSDDPDPKGSAMVTAGTGAASGGTGTTAPTTGPTTGPTSAPTSGSGLSGTIMKTVSIVKATAPAARDLANSYVTVMVCAAGTGLVLGEVTGAVTMDPALAGLAFAAGAVLGTGLGLLEVYAGHRIPLFFPSDEGGGGPRSNPAAKNYAEMPEPDGSGGGGGGPVSYSAMPAPDSDGGDGPRGLGSLTSLTAILTGLSSNPYFFPEPDGSGGGGPRT